MDDARALAGRLAEWIVNFAYHPSRLGDTRAIVEAELRQDFPEIDRLAAPEGVGLTRYELCDCRDGSSVMLPSTAPHAPWVRHEDAAAALAAEKARADEAEERIARHRQSAMERQHRIEAERDALKAALAPFADEANRYDKCRPERRLIFATRQEEITLTVGHLRDARAILSPASEGNADAP